MKLVLLSRAYCHLCEAMETELLPLLGSATLEVIDVDAPGHAALEAAWSEAVPVLFAGEPGAAREICRHRLDRERLLTLLAESPEIR